MSITKYLNLSHLRKLLSALGQRFYAIEQRQDNLQSQMENFAIPTKVSDLNNDSGFQTQTQVENAIAQSAEVVVVNLTSTTADDVTTYTADKTYAELYAAYAAGKTLILFKRMSSKAGSYFHLLSCTPAAIIFCQVDAVFAYHCFKIKNNNTIVKENYTNVRTINGKYNDVTLTYSDVGALPDSTVIPTKVSDLNNDSGFQTQAQVESAIAQSAEVIVVNVTSTTIDGVRTYTADKTFAELKAAHDAGKILILHSSSDAVFHICYVTSTTLRFSYITPVTFVLNVFDIKSDNTVERFDSVSAVRSVNNKKGVVTLTYSDVGALPDSTVIPTKVSDLNNDAGYQTQAQVNALISAAGDDDTTYAISISGNVITLTGSDGNTSTVTLPVYTGGVV